MALMMFTSSNILIKQASLLIVGPGTVDSVWSQRLLKVALSSDKPLVVDAGALRYLAKYKLKNQIGY